MREKLVAAVGAVDDGEKQGFARPDAGNRLPN
jgi:hypothetical protein